VCNVDRNDKVERRRKSDAHASAMPVDNEDCNVSKMGNVAGVQIAKEFGVNHRQYQRWAAATG
jgi:hypothetical protein